MLVEPGETGVSAAGGGVAVFALIGGGGIGRSGRAPTFAMVGEEGERDVLKPDLRGAMLPDVQ